MVNQGLKEVYDSSSGRYTIYQHMTSVSLKDVANNPDWLNRIAPGEKSGSALKAEGYCHHIDVFGDGTWWTCKLELAANRSSDAFAKRKCCACKKDQWWQTVDACKIRATWIQRISAADMNAGSGYTLHKWWSPTHEFDFVPDVVVNNVSVGGKMTPVHIAIQNCRVSRGRHLTG